MVGAKNGPKKCSNFHDRTWSYVFFDPNLNIDLRFSWIASYVEIWHMSTPNYRDLCQIEVSRIAQGVEPTHIENIRGVPFDLSIFPTIAFAFWKVHFFAKMYSPRLSRRQHFLVSWKKNLEIEAWKWTCKLKRGGCLSHFQRQLLNPRQFWDTALVDHPHSISP
jgi:hypothetical protein